MKKGLISKLLTALLLVGLLFSILPSHQAQAAATVTTEAELRTALADTTEDIVLGANITLTSTLDVQRSVVIDGANHIITGPSTYHAVNVIADKVTIKNLTITGTANGHNLQFYLAKGGMVENVVLSNGSKSGMTVNGSEVTISNVTTTGNAWGGINVDQGSGVTSIPKLTISNVTTHSSPTGTLKPAIWVDKGNAAWVEAPVGYAIVPGTPLSFFDNAEFAASPLSATLPVRNETKNAYYTTIQEAVGAAVTGDVITVGAGTYVGDLLLTKPITLQGTGDTTIIEGDIRYQSEDFIPGTMTLKDVMVVDSAAAFRMGVRRVGKFDKVVIDNVTMTANFDHTNRAISFDTVPNPDSEGDTPTLNSLTIKNSRVHSTLSVYLTGTVGEINIDNNDFYVTKIHWGSYNAININQYPGVPAGVYSITNNRIHVPDTTYGYATAITNQGLNQLAHGNELVASGNSIQVGTGTPNTDQSTFIKDKVVETNALYTVINQTKGTGYTTIQSAIDAASAGDTIIVSAGTYVEQLSIMKPLTLLGPNADKAGYADDRVSEAILTHPAGLPLVKENGSVWIEHPIIYINRDADVYSQTFISGVTIKGFKFEAAAYLDKNMPYGIRSSRVHDVVIENNNFYHVQVPVFNRGANGDDALNWSIKNNKFDGDIFGNSKTSYGLDLHSQQATVIDNQFDNFFYGMKITSYGFNSATPETLIGTVSGNTFNTTYTGIWLNEQYRGRWIFEDNSFKIAKTRTPWAATAGDIDVYSGLVEGYALDYQAFRVTTYSSTGTIVRNNTFDLSAPPSPLNNRYLVYAPSTSGLLTMHHNKITGYTHGIYSTSNTKYMAEKNWWGSASGPADGMIAGDVNYAPWCTDPECTEFLTMLSLSPEVIGEDASCDGTYTVDVVAQLVEDMQMYTVEMVFDPDEIEILSVENNAWENKNLIVAAPGNTLGNNNGRLIMGMYTERPGGLVEPETFTGTATLFTITFKAKGVGLEDPKLELDPAKSYYGNWPAALRMDFEQFNDATVKVNSVVTNTNTGKGYCDLGLAISEALADETLRMDADYTTADGYMIDKTLTLNLNGHNITRAGATDANFFRVNAGGDFTATGTGEIKTTDLGNNTIRVVGSAIGTAKFTLNGPTIDGTNSSVAIDGNRAVTPFDSKASYEAIFVMDAGKTLETILPLGKGATVVINDGEVRGYAPIQGNGSPQFFGTDITINGGLINGFTDKYDYNGIAIYHPQHGKLTINGGTIIGSNAIEMDAGDLIITGGTITANGDYKDVVDKANHSTDTGDAILVFHRLTYGLADKTVNINISGDPIITSEKAYALREFAPGGNTRLGLLNISGGKFTGAADKQAVILTTDDTAEDKFALTDGAYSTDPAIYVYIPLETYLDTTDNYYHIREMAGQLVAENFNWVNEDTGMGWLSGVTSGFRLEGATFQGIQSMMVVLTDENEKVLQTNTAVPAKFVDYDNAQMSSPFDIYGAFNYSNDGYWTNVKETEFGETVEPACVEVTVVLASGKPLTAKNCVLTGGVREDFVPKLVALDFGIMNFSNVMGYSAGFKPVNFGLHQVTGLKVELFAGTELLQTNLAVQPSDQGNASGISFSGPFDVFGTFDYTTDYVGGSDPQRVYWENTRASEYGQTLSPTRVVATATLPGGLEVVVENTNIHGERAWILPLNVSGVVTLQGQRTYANVPVIFTALAGGPSSGYVKNLVTTVDGNFSGDVVFHQKYLVTTNQPRYLNVTLGLNQIIDIQSATSLPALFLRGGNVFDWKANEINTGDVSAVGGAWGAEDSPFDANFDGYVNIQDLAMVGGNYLLKASDAYGDWLP